MKCSLVLPCRSLLGLLLVGLLTLAPGAAAPARAGVRPADSAQLCLPYLPVAHAGQTALLYVINAGNADTSLTLTLRSAGGAAAPLPSPTLRPASTLALDLADFGLAQGAYHGVLGASQPIEAVVHLRAEAGGVAVYQAAPCGSLRSAFVAGPLLVEEGGAAPRLALANPGSAAQEVQVTWLDAAGANAGAPSLLPLAAGGAALIQAPPTAPGVYSARVAAGGPVAGLVLNEGAGGWRTAHSPLAALDGLAATVAPQEAPAAPLSSLFQPLPLVYTVEDELASASTIFATNIGTGQASISIQFYATGSGSPISLMRSLAAGGSLLLPLDTLSGGEGLPASFVGSAIVSSNQPLAVETLAQPAFPLRGTVDGYQSGDAGGGRLLLPGVTTSSDQFSLVAVQNMAGRVARIDVRFFAADGALAYQTSSDLPAGSAALFNTRTLSALPADFTGAVLALSSAGPLHGAVESRTSVAPRGVAPTALAISGPALLVSGAPGVYLAAVDPVTATSPLTYTWRVGDAPPIVHGGASAVDTLTATFAATGVTSIAVEAVNALGGVTATRTLQVVAGDAAAYVPVTGTTTLTSATSGGPLLLAIPAESAPPDAAVVLTVEEGAELRAARVHASAPAFRIDLLVDGAPVAGGRFSRPVTVTVAYSETQLAGVAEEALALLWLGPEGWVDAATSCTPPSLYARDPSADRLTLGLCATGRYRLETVRYPVWLPVLTGLPE